MMGKKKADAVKTLLSMSGLNGRVGLEQYMLEYDKQIESLMRETKVIGWILPKKKCVNSGITRSRSIASTFVQNWHSIGHLHRLGPGGVQA
jgi:hypothetical protein